jgi:putative ABC transport system permease protein
VSVPGTTRAPQSFLEGALMQQARRHLRRSLGQFRTHPLRTALALLGMVLGVGSVVGMMSIGEGAQRQIVKSIEALGGNVVHLRAKTIATERIADLVNDSRGLSRADFDGLVAVFGRLSDARHVESPCPSLGEAGWARITPLGVSDLPGGSIDLQIVATTANLSSLHRLEVVVGRPLVALDEQNARRVVVLGADVATESFGDAWNAIGRRVRLGYAFFEVVGVLERKEAMRDLPVDPGLYNRALVVPFTTSLEELQAADAYKELDILSIAVADLEQTTQAKRCLLPVVQSMHHGVDDVEIVAPEEILEQKRATQATLNLVLISIAAISLLVGGIGVMNIMLANIMERIGEIGLRRAIGASRKDIRDQFLLESVIICFAGGLIGVIVGSVIAFVVGFVVDLEVAFAWEATLVSCGLSIAVGLVFGIWPALRAAAIHPIEALQHE